MAKWGHSVGGVFLLEDAQAGDVFVPEAFSPEARLMGQTADDFLRREVLPQTERIESGDHALMHQLMQRAGALGLLGADVPTVYGGLGLPYTTSALIAEKLNWQQSFALTHEAHTVIATLPLLFFGNDDQKRRYLPQLASGEWIGSFALSEANSGSDALGAQTKAVLAHDGTHYILNGTKSWITNTAFAQLFTVFAQVEGRFTAFLVERDFPGVSFGLEERKLGMRGTSTRRVILDNVPVPLENALEVGKGQYAAFCALNMGRFKLEAGAVGGLKETLAVCARYAGERRAFGHALSDFGLVQHKLAEMAARTFALESMVYHLAGDLDGAFDGIVADVPEASSRYHQAAEEFAVECGIVKVIGSETYSRMTDEAIQIHGGYGYTENFPVARAWRDQRLLRIGEGANEIVRLAIVNLLLRRDAQGRLPVLAAGQNAAQTISRTDASQPSADPLTALADAARDARQLALFLLHRAAEHLGATLAEAQETIASVADVICAAYALDSLRLRCETLKESQSPHFETALLAARVAARDHADEAVFAAKQALDALSLPDGVNWRNEPNSTLRCLLERLERPQANPVALRRELAAQVLDRCGYPL